MTNELTNEQAINELKAMREHIEPYMSIVGATAYDMAIKVLESQPCEDCISREEAWKRYKEWMKSEYGKTPSEDCLAYRVIYSLPSVQPQRKKGKWIDYEMDEEITIYRCSECNGYSITKYPFCNRCGADMREEEK